MLDLIKWLFSPIIDFFLSKKKLQTEQNYKKEFYNFETKQKPYNELLVYLSKLDEIWKIKSSKNFVLDKEKILFFHNIIEEFKNNLEIWKINSWWYRMLEKTALESYNKLWNALWKWTSNTWMFGNKDQLLKIWDRKNKLYQSIINELK
jgi:hypothetical protein